MLHDELTVAAFALPDDLTALDAVRAHLVPTLIKKRGTLRHRLGVDSSTAIARRTGRLADPRHGAVPRAVGQEVVQKLALALPDKRNTVLAKSAITQARQRIQPATFEYLFTATAAEWSARSADAHRWRGLAWAGV